MIKNSFSSKLRLCLLTVCVAWIVLGSPALAQDPAPEKVTAPENEPKCGVDVDQATADFVARLSEASSKRRTRTDRDRSSHARQPDERDKPERREPTPDPCDGCDPCAREDCPDTCICSESGGGGGSLDNVPQSHEVESPDPPTSPHGPGNPSAEEPQEDPEPTSAEASSDCTVDCFSSMFSGGWNGRKGECAAKNIPVPSHLGTSAPSSDPKNAGNDTLRDPSSTAQPGGNTTTDDGKVLSQRPDVEASGTVVTDRITSAFQAGLTGRNITVVDWKCTGFEPPFEGTCTDSNIYFAECNGSTYYKACYEDDNGNEVWKTWGYSQTAPGGACSCRMKSLPASCI